MSVSIATMGMFNPCCGDSPSFGGGAPPYRVEEEKVKPRILVKNMEIKTTDKIDDYLIKVKAKLVSFD